MREADTCIDGDDLSEEEAVAKEKAELDVDAKRRINAWRKLILCSLFYVYGCSTSTVFVNRGREQGRVIE
jgi:hypothetical protein